MEKQLKRKLNFLTGYVVVSLLVIIYLMLSSFMNGARNGKFDEITVKRINVIGEDGSLRMVISNETRQHSGRSDGKDWPKRQRPAGIIFFDNDGNECGGLIYGVSDKNGKIENGMSFTMDNYKNDQVVQLVNNESYDSGKNAVSRGLVVNEYPIGSDLWEFMEQYHTIEKIKDSTLRDRKMKALFDHSGGKRRLFVGRNGENQTGLFLYDTTGKPRMRIYVDKSGRPKIEVLDSTGLVVKEVIP